LDFLPLAGLLLRLTVTDGNAAMVMSYRASNRNEQLALLNLLAQLAGVARDTQQNIYKKTLAAHTLGLWPDLRGSNSSGFLLRTKISGARDQSESELTEFTKKRKQKPNAGAAENSSGDLLIDLGLELLEPALQALDGGVHALQCQQPDTSSGHQFLAIIPRETNLDWMHAHSS
jgi:hypothetical protein